MHGLPGGGVGDSFEYRLPLASGELQGACMVRWLHSADQQMRLGVELELLPANMRKLQLDVSRRQKQTVNALKLLGVPDSLI